MQSLRAVWIALPLSLFAACGGQSEKDDDGTGGSAGTAAGAKGGDAGTTSGKGGTAGVGGADGGAFSGGASGFGGTGVGADGGTSGTAGNAGTAGVGGGCCLLLASCQTGSMEVPRGYSCPSGFTCEDRTICCQTLTCATPTAQCNAFPSCDEGQEQIKYEDCPAGACYSRTLCGNTIYCAGVACNPDQEYNRHYVTTGSGCNEIDYQCPDQTTPFFNDCGCGCEQDSSCPMSVDCSPGPEPKPDCSDELLAKCPYTLRAL